MNVLPLGATTNFVDDEQHHLACIKFHDVFPDDVSAASGDVDDNSFATRSSSTASTFA